MDKQLTEMRQRRRERDERMRADERRRSELSRQRFEQFARDAEERQWRQREIKAIEANRPPGALNIAFGVFLGNLLSRMFGVR
jgi:hypothetical protein